MTRGRMGELFAVRAARMDWWVFWDVVVAPRFDHVLSCDSGIGIGSGDKFAIISRAAPPVTRHTGLPPRVDKQAAAVALVSPRITERLNQPLPTASQPPRHLL